MARERKQKRPAAQAPGRVKISIVLPAELARTLRVYAASLGVDQSDIVADLLRDRLAGFYWATRAPAVTARPEDPPSESLRVAS